MKIICNSNCVYSAEGRCTKQDFPDDMVTMQLSSSYNDYKVICKDYLAPDPKMEVK